MSAWKPVTIGFIGAVIGFAANAGLEMWLGTAASEREVFYKPAALKISDAKSTADIDDGLKLAENNLEHVIAPDVRLQLQRLQESAMKVRARFERAEYQAQQQKEAEQRAKAESDAQKRQEALKVAEEAAKNRRSELDAAIVIQREFRRLPWFAY